ncbi:hypothetical protein [Corynebacterium timonense]|nr:hypothetical protein [Corynebacterium timonense]
MTILPMNSKTLPATPVTSSNFWAPSVFSSQPKNFSEEPEAVPSASSDSLEEPKVELESSWVVAAGVSAVAVSAEATPASAAAMTVAVTAVN